MEWIHLKQQLDTSQKTSFSSYFSILGDRRDLVGFMIMPDWIKTITSVRVA